MKKTLFAFLFLTLSVSSFADEFCGRTQSDLKEILSQKSSRIAFKNGGGLINGGVCWWHNRLQRSSAYLVQYRPQENKPTEPELQKIYSSLRLMDQVVIIPGYSDFESFSSDHRVGLQNLLNEWQKRDGFFNFEWIRGISGRFSLPAGDMKLRMDDIYNHYKNSPTPLWIMAQIKGLTSHSLLILTMTYRESGYDMIVIDSNHPQDLVNIEYYHGDTFLHAKGEKYNFVPYAGFQNDFKNIQAALKKSCGNKSFLLDLSHLRDGEVEKNY
jgi:hypothetical protein